MAQSGLDHLSEANAVRDLRRHRWRRLNFFSVQSYSRNKRGGDEDHGIRPLLLLLVVAGFSARVLGTRIAGRGLAFENLRRAVAKRRPAAGTADQHRMLRGRL